MRKLREVCRLRFHAHLSLRQISNNTQVSLGTIQKIVYTVTKQGLDWPAIQALGEAQLSALITLSSLNLVPLHRRSCRI